MKVFTCNVFSGTYPVGVAATVVGHTKPECLKRLNERLRSIGLPGDAKLEDLKELKTTEKSVTLLCSGDY